MAEGGDRVPFLVRWPGVTNGTACDALREPVTTPDVYATATDAVGVSPPDQVVDGKSLRPLFAGDGIDREAVFWYYHHYGNQGGAPAGAIKVGDWKLVQFFETIISNSITSRRMTRSRRA